jgi:hypothetical protein
MYKSVNDWTVSGSAKKPTAVGAQIATINSMKRRSSYDAVGQNE